MNTDTEDLIIIKIKKLTREYSKIKRELQALLETVQRPILQYEYSIKQVQPPLNPDMGPYYAVIRSISNKNDIAMYNNILSKMKSLKIETPNLISTIEVHRVIWRTNNIIFSSFFPENPIRLNIPFMITDEDWNDLIKHNIFPNNFIIG